MAEGERFFRRVDTGADRPSATLLAIQVVDHELEEKARFAGQLEFQLYRDGREMLVLCPVQQFPVAAQRQRVFQVARPMFGEVLRPPKGVAQALETDVAADGYLHVLRKGEIEEDPVALPDGTVTVAGVVHRNVKQCFAFWVVYDHCSNGVKTVL